MSETIAKNTKKAKRAIENACNIRCYSLSNNFSGAPLTNDPVCWKEGADHVLEHVSQQEFLRRELAGFHAKLTFDLCHYTLHVHSNLWYEFDMPDWKPFLGEVLADLNGRTNA